MNHPAPGPAWVEESLNPDFRYGIRVDDWLMRQRSDYQQVEVVASRSFGRMLVLDGSFQCSERDEFLYHEPLVHAALLRVPEPRRVLIVGGGDGGAAEEALKHSQLEELVHVEIDAVVVQAARRFLGRIHRGVLDGADRRHRLVIADAAEFVDHDRSLYDAIILDLTDPGGPSTLLYHAEFLGRCAARLHDHGALSMHVASPWAQRDRAASALSALRAAFGCVTPLLVTIPLSGGPWLMAACTRPNGRVRSSGLRGRDETESVRQRIATLGGEPLRFLDAHTWQAMHAVPPYLAGVVRAAA